MPPSRPDENNSGNVSPRPPIGGPPPKAGAPLPAKALPAKPLPAKADTAAVTAALPMVPGDETVWEKYAPNGEPFLSSISSMLLHGLLLGIVLIGIGWLFSGPKVELDELETVEIGNGEEGGGGGSTEGEGMAPGNLSRPQDDVKKLEEDKTPKPTLPEEDLKVKATKDEIPDPQDLVMEKIKNKPEAKKLGPVLKDALEGLAGKGLGGSGQGGGEGTGFGKGKGSGVGDGTGRTNRRGRRQMRWELFWGNLDAHVYLQQTEAAGMWPVVVDRNGNPMRVIDYRQRPAKLELIDVKASKRNWFTDDKADSCANIASELGLDYVPAVVLFFYPIEFEEALLKKELAYAGRKEEDIQQTQFRIGFSGGKPTITVIKQVPFAGRK
jgi:hypothetical protein